MAAPNLRIYREVIDFPQTSFVPAGQPHDKFAVTLEPEGGVPRPTGAIHLLGTL